MPVMSTATSDGKVVTICVSGQFNFSEYRNFRDAYQRSLTTGASNYVIDLNGTEYMDSSALGMLLVLREQVGAENADIRIINCNAEIRKVFSIAHFDRLFRIE